MQSIEKYCNYLYQSFYIPVYLYEKDVFVTCYPKQETDTLPPEPYLHCLREAESMVSYTITLFHSFYGCIHIQGTEQCIVLGPVNPLPYSREIFHQLHKEFPVTSNNTEQFDDFFYHIPRQNQDTFLHILLFMNYTLNHTELAARDIVNSVYFTQDQSILRKYYETSFQFKEEEMVNRNYQVEKQLFHLIETGNIDGLITFMGQTTNITPGIVAENNLRQSKNLFIASVTLAVRASIKGGLPPSMAYQLSDTYIQQVERLQDIDAINSLLLQAMFEFTNRASHSNLPKDADSGISMAIKYIREHIHSNLTVSEVANYLNYNRSYLSRKFKQELGFDISKFIQRCKLEEAREMLTYSDKSISEISIYLCFSSQSHFQKAFKNQFGITPQRYRNAN